ncbi:GNAT family N-acetyltransferase [Hymenobacter tibetensis]|uniref:GNAT family N-acetyltransferase n=1 Tax=Hymenobacter tibetensis TaxID=497967 RepID=A0ABY4CWL4_9BACT|nr:GNAT family N-acetyltransferase [Hymenobacter tibetensis]UOG74157.1 GNAT family N-acetyltransferase [Hymenobacter tibetensis]
MHAALPPPLVPLTTSRLVLRPYQPTDKAVFFAVLDQNRRRLEAAFPARVAAVQTLSDATRTLAQFAHDWQSGRLYVLGIWHRETDAYLGDISLRPSWQSPLSAEIGYYLAAEAEGHGYAREALAAAVQFGFGEHLRAHHLTLRCRRNNPRSLAVAEAVGFRPVTTTRRRLWPLRVKDSDIMHYRLEPTSL